MMLYKSGSSPDGLAGTGVMLLYPKLKLKLKHEFKKPHLGRNATRPSRLELENLDVAHAPGSRYLAKHGLQVA